MAYKDTNLSQVCPYNNFSECCYEQCPFFTFEWGKRSEKRLDPYPWEPLFYDVSYVEKLGCKKAIAEIEANKPDNINVSVNNRTAFHTSVF